jgi:nucleoside 2-deoxyribosyltransferase
MMRYDVFVSHSHRDRSWVRRFVDALKRNGVQVWFDVEQTGPGSDLLAAVRRAVGNSRYVLVVVDPEYTTNPNTFFEAGFAIGLGKEIIFITPKRGEGLPSDLQARRFVRRSTPAATAREVIRSLDLPGAPATGKQVET